MIPGDQDPVLGLEQAHVRGRVARCLVDVPRPEVALDDDARDQRTVGLDHRGDPRRDRLVSIGVTAQRLLGHAALPSDLQPPGQRGFGIRGAHHGVGVIGVHPELAAGELADRRRLAPVVGVRVRADQQAHELQPEPDLLHRPLELSERTRLVRAGVHQHDPGP